MVTLKFSEEITDEGEKEKIEIIQFTTFLSLQILIKKQIILQLCVNLVKQLYNKVRQRSNVIFTTQHFLSYKRTAEKLKE